MNGQLDQPVGGGYTKAMLYAEVGVLNAIEVIAVDCAGNKSAAVTVDLRKVASISAGNRSGTLRSCHP
jgi:hypothetical protein